PADRFTSATEMAAALGDVATKHALTLDAAVVVASFGPTARAAVNRQRASVVRARQSPEPASPKTSSNVATTSSAPPSAIEEPKPANRARPLLLIAAAAIFAMLGFAVVHMFAEKKAPVPIAADRVVTSAVPRPTASDAPGSSALPPQPRKNPY
ncbi:MAG: hypothetical protein ABI461_22915, partial [Polyangiaceae bacterium]